MYCFRPYVTAAMLALALTSTAEADTIEETYAKLCSGNVRDETCDALRQALMEKLNAASDSGSQTATAPESAQRDQARVAKWGFLGKDALNGTQLAITQSMRPGDKFSHYIYGALLFQYEWISDTELKKTTTQLDTTSYSWGYGAKGQATPSPAEQLSTFVETQVLNEAQSKIDVTQRFVGGTLNGREHKYQLDIQPAANYGQPFFQQFAVNGAQSYVEGSYQGDNREVVSGTLEGERKVPNSYVRILKVEGLTRAQIDSLVAEEKQKFYTTISQFHQKQSGSDGWLKALIGAGVGLAVGQAYGLDSTQTLGAVMKGIEATGDGSAATQAAGSVGDQLISGQSSTAGSSGSGAMSGKSSPGSYPTKDNQALGACAGFTEDNYRTKALEGGGDSQLYTMCGQAFEYYVMYKRAIAQGYSEADAERTYAAHEKSARVAMGYLQSHGAR